MSEVPTYRPHHLLSDDDDYLMITCIMYAASLPLSPVSAQWPPVLLLLHVHLSLLRLCFPLLLTQQPFSSM